eukprot:1154869-Pelagomonas_calceolata.AAC.3
MILRCKLPDPSTTSQKRGTQMLCTGLRDVFFCVQHAYTFKEICASQTGSNYGENWHGIAP